MCEGDVGVGVDVCGWCKCGWEEGRTVGVEWNVPAMLDPSPCGGESRPSAGEDFVIHFETDLRVCVSKPPSPGAPWVPQPPQRPLAPPPIYNYGGYNAPVGYYGFQGYPIHAVGGLYPGMGITSPQARPQSAAAFQAAPPVSSESACEAPPSLPQGGLGSSGLLDASSASFLDVTGQSDTTLLQPPESPAHAAHAPCTPAEGRPAVDLNHNVRPKGDIKQEGAGGYGSPAALAPGGARRQCLAPSVALPPADAAAAGGGGSPFENELRAAAAHKMALSIRSFSITDAEYEALDDAARASPQSPAPSPHALAAHEPLAAYTIGAFLPEAQEAPFAEGVAAGGGQHYADTHEYKKESAGEGDDQGADAYAGVLPSAHFDVACYEAAGGDSGFLHQPHPAAHGGFSGSPFHDARTTSSSASDAHAHGDKDGGFAEAYGSYLQHQFGSGVGAHESLLGGTPRHQPHLHLQHPHLHADKGRAASAGPPPSTPYSASSPSSSNSTSTSSSLSSSSAPFAPASAASAMPSLAGSTILLNPMALLADSECEGAAAAPKGRPEFSTLDLAALQEEAHEVVICE
ncbi:atrophin-1-like [Penaeus indicus]|uniref:atrophin-1-like n=1 Tax=Penaeus indicus TaxID=29960 RepID=UPI00300D3DBF